jgi:archaellum component FlaF (FlaF/FlaG flagellin family)
METSIPALIIATMLLVSTVVLGHSGYSSYGELGDTWKAMETRAGQQARTQLTITGVTHSPPNSPYVDVQLRNDGSTRLAELERTDVVVEYTSDTGAPVLAWIPYTDGPLAPNTWTVQSIVNDAFEPGILNPSETLEMRIQLDPIVGNNTTNRLLISSDLGVTVSTTFQG